MIEKAAAAEFLGMEFATWLHRLSVTADHKVTLPGIDGELEIWFESPVALAADYGEATNVTLKGAQPLEGAEASTALREGKKLARSRVRVNFRNQTYTFTFNALNYSISGLKIPAPPDSTGPDHVFLRLEIFEEFERFWGQVFDAFLAIRLDDKEWAKERRAIAAWVRDLQPA